MVVFSREESTIVFVSLIAFRVRGCLCRLVDAASAAVGSEEPGQFFGSLGTDYNGGAIGEFDADTPRASGDIGLAKAAGADSVAAVIANGIVTNLLGRADLAERNAARAPEATQRDDELSVTGFSHQSRRDETEEDGPEKDGPTYDISVGQGMFPAGMPQHDLPDQQAQQDAGRGGQGRAYPSQGEALFLVEEPACWWAHRASVTGRWCIAALSTASDSRTWR
jgi:hypothetical protein